MLKNSEWCSLSAEIFLIMNRTLSALSGHKSSSLRIGACTILLVCALAGSSHGYVRSTSPKSGVPFRWMVGCIPILTDVRGSQDLSFVEVEEVLGHSAANWNDGVIGSADTPGCGSLRLMPLHSKRQLEIGADSQPIVVFRDRTWSSPGGIVHDPSAIAITTVFHINTPGQVGDATILDADIELNGVNFTFTTNPATATARPSTTIADLENTLTHELGHVLGLAHTCWDHATPTAPIDSTGQPAPDCNSANLPATILDATMYPYSRSAGETEKRSITDDDKSGICDVYPRSDTGGLACFQQVQGGCAMTPSAARGFAAAATKPHQAWRQVLTLLVVVGGLAAWSTRTRRRNAKISS